jgi:cytochrome c biogenesis protein
VATATPPKASERPAPRGPRLPPVPTPLETLGLTWRWLRRMSTALMLLLAMAVASIVATFIPQEPLIPSTVRDWRTGDAGPGEGVAAAFDALGLFDLYGTWWFAVLVLLLFTSLTGCLVPRWRAFARVARRAPPAGRNLDRLTNRATLDTALPPAEALAAVERVLARHRFRRARPGDRQLAGERGHWREAGSIIFHTSFYLLLAGAVIGQAFGFRGHVNLPEGAAFAETRMMYDLAEPGRYWDLDDHRGFVLTLEDFHVAWYENFTPSDFVSTITINEPDGVERTEQVRVNHPIRHDGMTIYQARWGMAPHVVVRAGDSVIFDEQVMLSDAGGSVWTGVAKVAMGGVGEDGARNPQIALDLVLLPDAAVTDDGIPFSRSPTPANPRLIADLWVGDDLGLERPTPARDFNRDGGRTVGPPAILAEAQADPMAGGALTVEFAELTYWSGFQISHGPARWLLLLAGVVLLAGLIPSLYSYRRRIWAEAAPTADGSRVTLAGVALQRKQAFVSEFATVRDATRAALEPRQGRE